ncbi:Ammonium transporter, putative [Perkinsus marinus ATCC 50983]|uniref:Ammonium transporter n=1 Tax=Perkinsus marinus (strain ATCC 50983 / TXsc) TaxID=423536 RepID=C5LAG4_PERM5|nr:Ammonium transporter, putative [Perkinsus marinus ATCC 50983]EER06420.1 Ammonium transporter, putative [Perkinsus marinus ATCC 50983]|eukprot:XP_002774604.1 Ammonium transporter, putative [Perkinsus marinus ATCC 50983]
MVVLYMKVVILASFIAASVLPDASTEITMNQRILELEAKTAKLERLLESYGSAPHRALADDPTVAGLADATDTIWLIICGALVMLMQFGFAALEAGSVRAGNVQNILLKNLLDVSVGTLCWWALGFGIAYGVGKAHGFFGNALYEYKDGSSTPSAGEYAFKDWFFQWAFCATAATIVSGGVAERVRSSSYFVYSAMMSAFIYPAVVQFTWSGDGWLSTTFDSAYYDFAGSGIVHLTGGVGALTGALILGPRHGRFKVDYDQSEFDPHSVPLIVLGTFVLWFGWFGFNAGSTLSMHSSESAWLGSLAAVNTALAAAAGGFVTFLIRFLFVKKYDVVGVCNGMLAGLVSITAGCANVVPGSAIAIATIGAVVYQFASWSIQKLKIDDPLDAFAVHGACGIWGVLAAPLWDYEQGFDVFSASPNVSVGYQFGIQLLGVVVIVAFVGASSAVIFGFMRLFKIFRVKEHHEVAGVDVSKHYHSQAYRLSGRSKESMVTAGSALDGSDLPSDSC